MIIQRVLPLIGDGGDHRQFLPRAAYRKGHRCFACRLGIWSTHPYLIKADRKIIVSIDKDMATIPGLTTAPAA